MRNQTTWIIRNKLDFQLLDSPIARQLEQSFKKRLLERRPANLVHLILFLENPSYWDKEKDFFGETIRKSQIKKLASDLVRRLFPEDINQYSSVNDVTFDEDDAPEIFDDSEKEKESVPELTKEQKFNLAWKKRKLNLILANLKVVTNRPMWEKNWTCLHKLDTGHLCSQSSLML